MAHWVQANDGSYINLDFCSRITPLTDSAMGVHRFRMEGGETATGYIDPEELGRTFVPAAPDAAAVLVSFQPDDNASRPSETDIWVAEASVVAWSVQHGRDHAEPVFLEQPASNETVLLPYPAGKFLHPNNTLYASLDEAKQCLLRDAQDAWDRKQQQKLRDA